MTQPAVTITELDGSLGVLPPSAGALFAMVGPASAGSLLPATFARVRDVVSAYTSGPLVEAAAAYIERYGKPVILTRTGNTVASTLTLSTSGIAGTSVITTHAGATADDDYEIYVLFVAGGTRGVAGITYRYSLDGGRTFSAIQSVGTATSITVPGSGGAQFDLAAGTIVAGDFFTCRTTAPNWNTAELTTAVTSLANSIAFWKVLEVVGPIDANAFDALETAFTSLFSAGKYRMWVGNTRMPTVGETEAAYKTALDAIFSTKASTRGALCAGACKLSSSVSGRKYKRPIAHIVAALEASVDDHIDIADINLGSLPGVSIRDVNGNPDEHDETINPGLDDSRFVTLRTWDGYAGVYVNRPRIYSAEGSDFQLMPHRRVLNEAHAALRAYFIRRLNQPILVNATTGFILEEEALEIEKGAEQAMASVLLAAPKASAVTFSLSRTDNVLSTKTLTGQARVTPLAYPEFINLDVGFVNPALQVVAQ